MIYETMTEPPEPGTPMESLMLLVWRRRQDIEVHKTRLLAQATLAAGSEDEANANSVKKAWTDYLDETFPFQKSQRVNADQAAINYLKRVAEEGPWRVIPLQPLSRVPSRLRSRAKR